MRTEEIKIADDCKYVIIVEDKDMILNDRDLHAISDVLREWWEGNEKFLILAEWGNLNITFKRMEKL
jgi:hypothetical protein